MIEGWTTETYLKNLCISLPAMYYQVDQQIGLSQKYNKMYYDQDVHDQKFELGDEVIVKNYHHEGPWTANWVGPYTVTDKKQTKNRKQARKWFHIDQIKSYKHSEDNPREHSV